MILPKQIQFEMNILLDQAWVYGNQTQLQEVLWNLCSNGRDAMKETGGTLLVAVDRVERGAVPENVGVSRYDGSFLRILVADTGCGMDTSILEHLFDSFYTTKPAGEGSGLGLSISYDIVCQHGGDIKVETEVERAAVLPYICHAEGRNPRRNRMERPAQLCCCRTEKSWMR